jgi:hypothetical protein
MQRSKTIAAAPDAQGLGVPAAGTLAALPLRIARKVALNLFGVSLGGDLHERAADWSLALPLSPPRARRIEHVRQAGILFIHVPKCAGMAICRALYGTQLKHGSIRWYRRYAPQLDGLPSFAIVRDPVDRFVSAYRYAVAGGTADNRVAPAFHDRYRRFRCLDEAMDHVEAARGVYRLDHIFRSQCWYVTDAAGRIDVDWLFDVDDPALPRFIQAHGGTPLTPFNCSDAPRPAVSSSQAERIRGLYRADVELHALITAAKDANAAASGTVAAQRSIRSLRMTSVATSPDGCQS